MRAACAPPPTSPPSRRGRRKPPPVFQTTPTGHRNRFSVAVFFCSLPPDSPDSKWHFCCFCIFMRKKAYFISRNPLKRRIFRSIGVKNGFFAPTWVDHFGLLHKNFARWQKSCFYYHLCHKMVIFKPKPPLFLRFLWFFFAKFLKIVDFSHFALTDPTAKKIKKRTTPLPTKKSNSLCKSTKNHPVWFG